MNPPDTTDTPTIPPAQSPVKSDNDQIAFSVVWFPELFSALSQYILENAVLAGLKRHSIAFEDFVGYFRPSFSVGVFYVAPASAERAVDALEKTLNSLGLSDLSAIAIQTGDMWVTVSGIGRGEFNFADVFLGTATIRAAMAEAVARLEPRKQALDRLKNLAALVKDMKPEEIASLTPEELLKRLDESTDGQVGEGHKK
jgi:hypothetical protein